MRSDKMPSVGVVLCAIIGVATLVHGQDIPGYRLPTYAKPSNYKLAVTPYLVGVAGKTDFTFDGTVEITFSTNRANVQDIVLQARNLRLDTIRLIIAPGLTPFEVTQTSHNTTTDKLTLRTPIALQANVNYVLQITYAGVLDSDMKGFYRTEYTENGQTKWAASTQFQTTSARQAFPCFDEPSFKATFDVIINRPESFKPSYSNGQLIDSLNIGSGLVRETFERTPIMSTYLLAFIVSEFDIRETPDKTFGVISRPAAIPQTEYAFDVGLQLLDEMNKWTDYNYTSVMGMTKMQMAALPDFSAGAMENWGLLTYRETNLLWDPLESTALSQQRVAGVIVHEQAHMWFGDLVTCDWWSNTWLNEGFARLFQYFGQELVNKDWDLDLQYVVEQLHTALTYDASSSTHPLTHEVNSQAEVAGIFSSISYNKASAVLRMMQHIMGKDAFQKAMQEYLKENAFKTTLPETLFAAMQKHYDGSIVDVMRPYTVQPGFPVVHIERTGPTTLKLRQERYFEKKSTTSDSSLWEISLSYATSANRRLFDSTASQLSLKSKDQTVEIANIDDWAIFNVQQTGYYRVNYDANTWKNISIALKATNHSSIHVLNRAQIIDDLLNLARAEYVDYTLALDVVQYLETETHYIPWLTAITNFNILARRLSVDNMVDYKKYIIKLTENANKYLGFDAKPNVDKRIDIYNRANILGLRCKYGEKECVSAADAQFSRLKANAAYRVPADIRSVVFCTAIANGNQEVWDLFWNRFLTAEMAAEQVILLTALGCTTNNTTLLGYLDHIVSASVRKQDKSTAISAAYTQQAENVQVVLDYVLANHEAIGTSFGDNASSVAGILAGLAARFTTRAQIEQVKTFRVNTPAYSGFLNSAIADAEYNLDWSQKHVPTIVEYIKQQNSAAGITSAIVLIVMSAVVAVFH